MKRFSVPATVALGLLLCMAVLSPSQTFATDPHAVNTNPQETSNTPQEQHKADETDEVVHALGAPPAPTSDNEIDEQMEGEWRPLCSGQSMLYGAHVRLDMTTGARTIFVPKGKEAEYSDYANECPAEIEEGADAESTKGKVGVLPASSSTTKYQEHLPTEASEVAVPAARDVTDVEQMDTIMRSLPEPDVELQALDKSKLSPEEYDAAIRKLWTHRQTMIKKVMEGLQNDAKEMHKHLANLGDVNSTNADRTWNLEILEDLVGTVDNAQDFARIGGLDVCALLLSTSDTDTEVKAHAALLIGSASKYVEEVQMKANEIGLLGQLLGHMTSTSACGATSEEPDAQMLCSRLIYAVGSLVRGSSVNQVEAKTFGLVNVLQQLAAKSPHSSVRAKAFTLLGDLTLERHCPNAAVDHQRMLLSEMLSEVGEDADTITELNEVAAVPDGTVCEASPLAMALADREHGKWFADQVRRLVDLTAFPKPRHFAKVSKAIAHACSAYVEHNCDLRTGMLADANDVDGKELISLLEKVREAVGDVENHSRNVDVSTAELRQTLERLAVALERIVDTDLWSGPSKCAV